MIRFTFDKSNEPLKVLCIGAHSDDIEIGCGGAILTLSKRFPASDITWIVFSAAGSRSVEASKSADAFLRGFIKKQTILQNFKDGYLPYQGALVKDYFEQLKLEFSPDIIFTHYRDDLHQDHRLLCELTWNTWRNNFILEYEIPKYDGDLGSPNLFISLDEEVMNQKIELLVKYFQTQSNKHWFSPETFRALLRLRGVESKAPSGYAEAFYCRKLLV